MRPRRRERRATTDRMTITAIRALETRLGLLEVEFPESVPFPELLFGDGGGVSEVLDAVAGVVETLILVCDTDAEMDGDEEGDVAVNWLNQCYG